MELIATLKWMWQAAVEVLTAASPVASFNSSGGEIYYSDDEVETFVSSAAAAPQTPQIVGKTNKMEWVHLCLMCYLCRCEAVRLEVFIAVRIQFLVFWVMTSCGVVLGY